MNRADIVLREAIAQSYHAFSTIPLPRQLRASRLRNPRKILATLSAAPLRELTGEQIGPYSSWAMTTVGDGRDYRHFLPRIFELAITDPVWLGFEPPVMADKLNRAGWRTWPDDQQSAVLGVFRSAFAAMMEHHPDEGEHASSWLCGLALLGDSPASAFETWRSSTSPNAALHLASFVIGEAENLQRHRDVRSPFWEDVDAATRHAVAEQLESDATKTYLRAAAALVTQEDRTHLLDAALRDLARSE